MHMDIIMAVLESARDVGEENTVAACRRLIVHNRTGWTRRDLADMEHVMEIYNEVVMPMAEYEVRQVQ